MKRIIAGIDWKNSRVFDFLIEALILIVIFIMPTIFDRRLGIVFSGTKTTWMRVFGILLLSAWSIKIIVTREHRFFRTALDWPVVSFLLGTTIATLTSVNVYTSFAGFYGRYEGLTSWYLFGIFFFVITNYMRSSAQIKKIFVTVISAGTLMAVYSIVQRHAWDPYMWGGVVTWQRVIGTIGQPNFLAAYMLMAFFLGLALLMMGKKEVPGAINWYGQLIPLGYFLFAQAAFLLMIYNLEAHNFIFWYLSFALITASAVLFSYFFEQLHPRVFNVLIGLCLVLIYVSMLYTQSRGGYLGLFTGGVFYCLVAGRKWVLSSWRKMAALLFLIVLISGVTMTRPEFSPFQRFATEITTEQVAETGDKDAEEQAAKLELKGAAGSRGETWKSAFRIVHDHPVFGIGPEVMKMVFPRYETDLFRFKETFHVKQDRSHNETFDVSVTKGLVTFFVYLWLLFVLFRVGWQKAMAAQGNQKIMLAGLLGASVAFLIQNQFSFGVVAITSLFWMIWAMVMVVGEEDQDQDKGKKISWLELPWLMVALVMVLAGFLIYVSFFSFRGDIWFKSGKTMMQMRRVPQAIDGFERSLRAFPYEGGTVSHLGIAYLNHSNTLRDAKQRTESLNKAIGTLRYGTLIDPYNADNFFMLSRIHFMLYGMGDKESLADAQQYAEVALKIDPYYAEVYHILGLIQERQGRIKEAARNMEKAFFINPNLNAPMQDLENLNRRQGRVGETIKAMERFLEKYSANRRALERAARLYLELGKTDQALAAAEKMIRHHPQHSAGYIFRAVIHVRQGRIERAFADLRHVVRKDPKNVMAHNELGRLYLLTGNKAKAREEFESALMLDSGNAFAKKMLETLK